MQLKHFETLRPVCPRCRGERAVTAPLTLEAVAHQEGENVLDGLLRCSNSQCRMAFPIFDGVPLLISNLNKYISDNIIHIVARRDYSATLETVLGEALGPGTPFNVTRHHLSSYGWDHYGDQAPASVLDRIAHEHPPGSAARCLKSGLQLIDGQLEPPALDIGCAAGRTTFELAATTDSLTLGIDLNFMMLRFAQSVLRNGRASFPLKKVGLVYERLDFPVQLPGAKHVDFWACDALNLPFSKETFGFVSALNVFDIVHSPRDLLLSIRRTLRQHCHTVLATPYDWSSSTPPDAWIGGRDPLGAYEGAAEPMLRAMLTPGENADVIQNLKLVGEIENHPWHIRVHNRHTATYNAHLFAAKKTQA